jgi:alkylated DNA repair dioxygenase AlkB
MSNIRSPISWQPSLLDAGGQIAFDCEFSGAHRLALDDAGAWVEHVPSWVSGAGALFAEVVESVEWKQRRVHMYDRMVDEPRLTAWYGEDRTERHAELPAVVYEMAGALSARYGREFDSVGTALYRDGRDSVAWHGDRIPAEIVEPVVGLISLGSARVLRMRRKAAHADTRAFRLLPGDLFVMGGTSQRAWEHSVPKVVRAGPRLSLQFRHTR